jgi:hypothetical protein
LAIGKNRKSFGFDANAKAKKIRKKERFVKGFRHTSQYFACKDVFGLRKLLMFQLRMIFRH